MSESVKRQVQGKSTGAMMKADGWVEYHVDIGRQYPVKLATKKDDVKLLAAQAGAEVAIWTFNESNGNPNPHRPGEFFKNRYLENVEVGGTLDPALTGAGQQGQQTLPVAPQGGGIQGGQMPMSEGREASIERQTIVKAVLASDWKFENEDQLIAFLDKLDAWIAKPRVKPDAPAPEDAAPAPADTTPPGQGGEDDDIPF